MPALRGGNTRGIRHLESFVGGLNGVYYDTLMLVRDSKLGMKNVRRMQFVNSFVDVRQLHTRSCAGGYCTAHHCQDSATLRETRTRQTVRQTQSHHHSAVSD